MGVLAEYMGKLKDIATGIDNLVTGIRDVTVKVYGDVEALKGVATTYTQRGKVLVGQAHKDFDEVKTSLSSALDNVLKGYKEILYGSFEHMKKPTPQQTNRQTSTDMKLEPSATIDAIFEDAPKPSGIGEIVQETGPIETKVTEGSSKPYFGANEALPYVGKDQEDSSSNSSSPIRKTSSFPRSYSTNITLAMQNYSGNIRNVAEILSGTFQYRSTDAYGQSMRTARTWSERIRILESYVLRNDFSSKDKEGTDAVRQALLSNKYLRKKHRNYFKRALGLTDIIEEKTR